MIIQSITSVYERIQDAIVSRVYKQLVDEQSQKVYYECIVYTRKGNLEVHTNKNTIDTKA